MNRLWWVIIGLAAVIVLMILFDRDPEPVNTQIWKDQIAKSDVRIIQLQKDSAKLAHKIAQDSVRQANEKKTYQATIEKKSREIANLKANPIVIKIREETPEIDSLLIAYEASDSIKTERIAVLEKDNDELRVDMSAMKTNFSGMLEAERDKFEASQEMNKELEKQVRKEKRKATLFKITTVVAGVGMLLLGASL